MVGGLRSPVAAGANLWLIAKFFTLVENDRLALPSIWVLPSKSSCQRIVATHHCRKDNIPPSDFHAELYRVRFQQLQQWQSCIMPPELFGGIRGRRMSQLYTGLKLSIDNAQSQSQPLIGWSRQIEVLRPHYSQNHLCPLTALGIPKEIMVVFLKLYSGLRRH